MLQTTLFNYFNCNNIPNKQTKFTKKLTRQTSLKAYFYTISNTNNKKRKTVLDYFKKKPFDLVLVDIKNSENDQDIKTVKRSIYDENLEYISISYRWGENSEQLVETPDYTAHVTSFCLYHLLLLCNYIKKDPKLKHIPYLWIDTISVDQQNHKRKKETILKMSEIYNKATYILAVPDLHLDYLWKNPANRYMIKLLQKYRTKIYEDITNSTQLSKTIIKEDNNEDIKKAYEFLGYLVDDWADRAWVISEYQIAKRKEKEKGTPLKFMFISLLSPSFKLSYHNGLIFFSFYFNHKYNNTNVNNTIISTKTDSSHKLIEFLINRLSYRKHLEMILNSNATKNEDRFNAILPTWTKYNYLITNKDTISEWKITNMTSVRLKLYEILDNIWDKARLLYACTPTSKHPILPSFASSYSGRYLNLIETYDLEYAYKRYSIHLLNYVLATNGNNKNDEEYKKISDMKSRPIFTENLSNVQFSRYYISVTPNTYFIVNTKLELDQKVLTETSLEACDNLMCVFLPYYTYSVPNYTNVVPICSTSLYLIGCMDKNRWVLTRSSNYKRNHFLYSPCSNSYSFNIY